VARDWSDRTATAYGILPLRDTGGNQQKPVSDQGCHHCLNNTVVSWFNGFEYSAVKKMFKPLR
jgi:hypothetical protein